MKKEEDTLLKEAYKDACGKIDDLTMRIREMETQLKRAEENARLDRVRIDTLKWCIELGRN